MKAGGAVEKKEVGAAAGASKEARGVEASMTMNFKTIDSEILTAVNEIEKTLHAAKSIFIAGPLPS